MIGSRRVAQPVDPADVVYAFDDGRAGGSLAYCACLRFTAHVGSHLDAPKGRGEA